MLIDVLLLGLVVGLLSSTLGVGGGIVIIPVLSIYLGFSHIEAIATSLLTIVLVTASNAWRFQMKKLIDWSIVLYVVIFSAIVSFSSGIVATHLNLMILLLLFILFLFFLIIHTLRLQQENISKKRSKSRLAQALKIGLITGAVSGFIGIGGGSIATPLLLSTPGLKKEKAVPISNGIMFFTSAFAVLAYILTPCKSSSGWQFGCAHLDISLFIFIGSLPSAYLGAKFQGKIPLFWRKILLSILLIIILARMLVRFYNII